MRIEMTSNAAEYGEALLRYATETGKELSAAVQRELPDFATELWRQFKAISPKADSIEAAAKARHFSMGRISNQFTRAKDGISTRAWDAAGGILAGDKSDLFRVLNGNLVPVRFSARRGNRVLRGKRTGRSFSNSALRASQLSDEAVEASLAKFPQDVVRLNMRAAATYYEMRYRQRAARGGWMALQWLNKTWRKGTRFDASTGYSTQLDVSNRRPDRLVNLDAFGRQIGTVEFEVGRLGVEAVVLTGFVPGTAEQMQRHGILGKVAAVRTPALARAIELHHAKVAREHGL